MEQKGIQLSIITVNLNNAKGLSNTFETVLKQHNPAVELLVIDGGSVDESLALIKGVADKLSYWVSERDSGIYAAMNKGIEKARGSYILFLNSGDTLVADQPLNECFSLLDDHSDILSFCIQVERYGLEDELRTPIKKFTLQNLLMDSLPHQSTLIKRSLFLDHGYYDEGLRVGADWDFWLRLASHPIRYKHSDLVLSRMEKEGIGANMNNHHYRERLLIFGRYAKDLRPNFFCLRLMYRNRKLLAWYLRTLLGTSTSKNHR
jgi:glycosyltransferase involved in cell wall biosynthesis